MEVGGEMLPITEMSITKLDKLHATLDIVEKKLEQQKISKSPDLDNKNRSPYETKHNIVCSTCNSVNSSISEGLLPENGSV